MAYIFNGENDSLRDDYFNRDIEAIKRRLHYVVIQELNEENNEDLSVKKVREIANRNIKQIALEERVRLSSSDRERVLTEIVNEVIGYGPIQEFIDDPEVTEIMVNGPEKIYIEKDGRIIKTRKRFFDENHLMRIIAKIVSQVGRRIDESSPMVDARLPDGSRINATIPPISVNGPTLNIRKFRKDVLKPEDIVSFGTATQEVMDFLKACVLGRLNIVISGGTGTGKTTLLNVLSSFIPYDERIITIEDAVELSLQQEHVVKLEARPPNVEGKGEIRIRDLVINALRMRPDRIIVGEVRGGEAVDMLQAMNTGHDGSLTTVHANSPRDALLRIETMVMMAGMELTLKAIRSQMASAIDLIIHMARLKDGSRKIMEIVEVQGMEGDTITLAQIFRFEFLPGLDERRKISGRLRATGIRPYFVDKLEDMGIALPPGIFEPDSLVL